MTPLDEYFDALPLRTLLTDFTELAKHAEPEEMQRLIRLVFRRVVWNPEGVHHVEFYNLPKTRPGHIRPSLEKRFTSKGWLDGPDRTRTGDLLRDRQAC